MTVFLAWVWGPKGPSPQLWHTPFIALPAKHLILARRELTEVEAQLPLEQIARLYPPPRPPDDTAAPVVISRPPTAPAGAAEAVLEAQYQETEQVQHERNADRQRL